MVLSSHRKIFMELARPRFAAYLRAAGAPAVAALAAVVGLMAPASFNLASEQHGQVPDNHGYSYLSASAPVDTPPGPAVAAACSAGSTVASCDQATLSAINSLHRSEGLGRLALPRNYASLSYVGQIVAVTNAERTSRGLPALRGPRWAYDLLAAAGAAHGDDPAGPSGATWVSNMAAGVWTPLQADYEWMYNDGPGGSNADCTATSQSGCWEHRDNILSPWPGSIGAAVYRAQGPDQLTFAELIVKKD